MTTSANRVTLNDIEQNIVSEYFFTAAQGVRGSTPPGVRTRVAEESLELLTFCVLILRNGFTVTGQSACVDPANFDREIGESIARTEAINKVWPLMGYALKEELSQNV